MEYKNFIDEIKSQVETKLGKEIEVTQRQVIKNNNVKMDGIVIQKEEDVVAPTIYLNHYYESYESGMGIEAMVEEIIEIYYNHKVEEKINIDFFEKYENVEDKVVFKMIHYDKNKTLLEDVPHIRFLDLAVVFYYLVQQNDFGTATILIHHSHLQKWGKTIDEILVIAKENTQNILQVKISSIEDMIREELGKEPCEKSSEGTVPMYVMTNQTKLNGAACMLYPRVLKNFSRQIGSDLIILPSSIHELIIIPKEENRDVQELMDMVRETNDNHVEEEEILSYSVYQYLYKKDKINIL